MRKTYPSHKTRDELISWYDTITKQYYFANKKKIMIQNEGLAMGAPTAGLIAEFILHNLENTHLAHLTEKRKITEYFRYVEAILPIYIPDHTNTQDKTDDFNSLHSNITFTDELETNNKLNYLHISIHRTPTGWETSINRKHTFIETIIPYSSNHPAQHKYADHRGILHEQRIYKTFT